MNRMIKSEYTHTHINITSPLLPHSTFKLPFYCSIYHDVLITVSTEERRKNTEKELALSQCIKLSASISDLFYIRAGAFFSVVCEFFHVRHETSSTHMGAFVH